MKSLRLLLTAALAMLLLCGCGARYRVDYQGRKDSFSGAKDSYRAGERVVLVFDCIATDTDYTFYLDGEYLEPHYVNDRYELRFVMPAHDITVTYTMENTMEYDPQAETGIMLVDYYDGVTGTVDGDSYEEYVLYSVDDTQLLLSVYRRSGEDPETVTDYLVPISALEEARQEISRSGMDTWQDLELRAGPTGRFLVCKYRTEDGSYVRVSSDALPPEGEKAMDAVGRVLRSYAVSEYLIDGTEE